MNLENATKILHKNLASRQDPDHVDFEKQWDEFGRLKGWLVLCSWSLSDDLVQVTFDMTSSYVRTVGPIESVPFYKSGVHQ